VGASSGGSAVGKVAGRATALTLLLPLNWTGSARLRLIFWWLGRTSQRRHLQQLDLLRFIYAIRWSLLPPLEPGAPGLRGRPLLLFESNFTGDWDEYLEVFGSVQGPQLDRIVQACADYPGLGDLQQFKAWAKLHDHTPEHYATAYPTITPLDIRRHLAATTDGRSTSQVQREGYGRGRPSWSTFLVSIAAGQTDQTIVAARRLSTPAGSQLLVGQSEVHFARVVVITRPARSWVLLTITHDGPIVPILRRMLAEPATDTASSLRQLLDTAGVDTDAEHRLLAHQIDTRRATLRYSVAPGWTATELAAIADAPDLHHRWPPPEHRT
jgi:hypothetical protein